MFVPAVHFVELDHHGIPELLSGIGFLHLVPIFSICQAVEL